MQEPAKDLYMQTKYATSENKAKAVCLNADDLVATYTGDMAQLVISDKKTKETLFKINFFHDELTYEDEKEFLESFDRASDELGCEGRRQEGRREDEYQKQHDQETRDNRRWLDRQTRG